MTTTPSDQPLPGSGDDETFGEVTDQGYGAGVEDPATGFVDQDDMNYESTDPTIGSTDDFDEGHGVASQR